jgi:hypothetical protein
MLAIFAFGKIQSVTLETESRKFAQYIDAVPSGVSSFSKILAVVVDK